MGHFLHISGCCYKDKWHGVSFFTDSNVPKRDKRQFYEYVISKVSS